MGPNGTGKSTLLKAITGQDGVKLTTGRMVLNDTCRVGYLEQKGVSGSTRTVQEEVRRTPSQIQKIQGYPPIPTIYHGSATGYQHLCSTRCDAQTERCLSRCSLY